MPSYFNSWYGIQTAARRVLTAAVLKISDGDLTVDFTDSTGGWALLQNGWAMRSPRLKGGGSYSDSKMSDGRDLRFSVLANVVESWRLKLNFYSPDGMFDELDDLEELLTVRAPRYWTDPRNHSPVYVERAMAGETNSSFYLISRGELTYPQTMWNRVGTIDNCTLQPILLTYERQPLTLGAIPGQVQDTVELSATQDWDYDLLWAQESALPGGSVFCFVETVTGDIYAGGASEILLWNGSAWAVVATAPVVLAADVTSVVLLANGDLLFGESGRVIKRTSAGVWSVETSTPSGQVYGMVLASDGVVWACDNGQILKRDQAGAWTVDDTLPSGQTYSAVQASDGRVFVGGTGEILAQVTDLDSTDLVAQPAAATDNAEQYGSTMYVDPTVEGDLDIFNRNYVAVRVVLDVPAGATINSAKFRMFPWRTVSGTSDAIKVYCEDIDDSPAFTSADDNISNRTLTTEYVAWQDTVQRRRNKAFETPEFATVLQEVVDRGGWATGQHVTFIFKADTLASGFGYRNKRRQVFGYDRSPAKSPALLVTYTPAPAANAGWVVNTTLPTGNVRSMLQVGDLLLAGEDGRIISSDSLGGEWAELTTLPTNECRALYDDGDNVWGGDNGNILKSADRARNWAADSTLPTGYIHAFIEELSTQDVRAGDSGRILILDASDTVTLGRDDTDLDEVFVANHHKTANITHIKVDDGGVFTDIFPASSFPQTLLPAVPAVNDALYLIIDTSLADTGPLFGFVFDIETPASSTVSYTITAEYYNGGAYAALTTVALDETSQFSEVGVRGYFFKMPSDMATVAVDGVTGYPVRFRVSALTGTLTPPTQQNRDIYSPSWAFVELDAAQTKGNYESLIQMHVHNRSDNGGPGGSEPLLYENRVVAGVKEYEDHESFRAFLNIADEQNPTGVSVDVSVDTDSATSIEADAGLSSAVGRRTFFDAGIAAGVGGLNNLIDRVSIDLDTTVARDFYGTYKAFLRCKQNGGSAGEVTVRLKVVSGTGGITSVGDRQVTQSTTDHEIIEFDSTITLPVSAQMTPSDIGDTTSIVVQISASQSDADLYLYDLVLIPTDEAWIDTKDQANTAESAVENGRRLVVDSITIPKSPTRAFVQKLAENAFVSSWRVAGNGEARLLAQTRQRVWFLAMRTNGAASTLWLSEPEVCNSVTISKVDRWLLGRGAA